MAVLQARQRTATLLLTLAIALLAAGTAHAGQVGVTISIQGSGIVTVVEGSIEDGRTGTCDWRSNLDERVTNSCARFRNEEAFEAWVWLRATPNANPAGHWRFAGWTGCDQLRGSGATQECAVHSSCCNSVERFPKAHFADDHPPTIVSGPTESFSTTQERTVAFFFASNEAGTTECRFDAEVNFTTCTSGISRTFSEGDHTIYVRGRDFSGQAGPAVSRTVKVIDTAITGGPEGLTNNPNPSFTFSTGAGTSFECSMDGGAFEPCASGKSYPGIANGPHTFRVRAKHEGWFDRIPAQRTFTVDTVPPETTLGAHGETPGEGAIVTTTSATFVLQGGSSYECRLDAAEFAPCTSPHRVENLAPGPHAFEARAIDLAGNVDPTPVRRAWTVNPPDGDGDGYHAGQDCDDANPNVNPGKPEILDNDVDENCDGEKGINYDRDGDGSNRPADCDDNDARRTPGKTEILDNDVDEDCNGVADRNLDRDGDGSTVPADCDDGNAAIRPGAVDVPGNALDEDCANGPAALTIAASLTHAYKAFATFTRFTKLGVKGVPAGATVVATCKTGRKACKGKAGKTVIVTGKSGTVLFKSFTKQKLKPRTTITITITRPHSIGRVIVVTIRKKRAPKITTRAA